MPTSDIIARNTLWWANEVDRLEAQIASLRNDINTYNQVLAGLKSGDLPWERVQLMETGQLKILQPASPVPDICTEEITQGFGKNGKSKAAVAPPCGPQPVEVAADGN